LDSRLGGGLPDRLCAHRAARSVLDVGALVAELELVAQRQAAPLVLPPADAEIIDRIIAPAAPQEKRGVIVNEGFRFVCLGETGSGKTSLMRAVVYMTIARGYAQSGFIHDTKNIWPEYPRSIQVRNVAEFLRGGGFRPGDIPVVSFRGDPRADIEVTAEEVAKFSLDIARRGRLVDGQWRTAPHVTVIEELSEAASGGRKKLRSPSVLKLLEQGRKMGVSLVGTTQSPANVPLDILRQASSIAFFRLTGPDTNYLRERLHLDEDLINTVSGPNNEGLPNYHFCLYTKGAPWDRQVHTLDKRTALMFE
jgi:hypothetical protein